MNVLIVGKPFYNYQEKIAKEFKRKGYDVSFFSEIQKNHLAIRRLLGAKAEKRAADKQQNDFLKNCGRNQYDVILVLVGRYLSRNFLKQLKKNNPSSRLVLYLWDDIARVENFEEVYDLYDKIYSFDIKDCEENSNFEFLPLFYSREYRLRTNNKQYDIYGSFSEHSDRKRIAKSIYKQGKHLGLNCKFVFFPGRYKYIKDYFQNKKVADKTDNNIEFVYKPISDKQNISNVLKSKALLDIQYESQNGLTMRSIESVGAGVKLITTNENIKRYDFYNPVNCFIINRDHPYVDRAFLTTPYEELPEQIRKKYSIESWVSVIIGEKNIKYLK